MEQKYLLRVWEGSVQNIAWHASLKNIETKETKFFTDFESFKKHFAVAESNSDRLHDLDDEESEKGSSE